MKGKKPPKASPKDAKEADSSTVKKASAPAKQTERKTVAKAEKGEGSVTRLKSIGSALPSIADALPSTEVNVFWLYATGPSRPRIASGSGGKWMIFVDRKEVDALWRRVTTEVRNGTLGGAAKVSTARPNPNSRNPNKHVICVYTDNAEDETEIRRVREELRSLGISWKIGYKTDSATRDGTYENRGATRISKFWE